jgi:Domain of unknown function (DUF4260)
MDASTLSEGVVAGDVLIWLKAEGLAVVALSLFLYWHLGGRWWIFVALLLAPDLFMLGYLINAKIGALFYNVVHSYLLPMVIGVAAMAVHRPGVIPLLCIWTAHIGLDRLLGYGLKYQTGFKRTHLGILGKASG